MFTITVTNVGSGESAEIGYSVLSWANRIISQAPSPEAVATAKALYLYNQAAKAYLGQ